MSRKKRKANPCYFIFQFSETSQQITLLKRLQISAFRGQAHEISTSKQEKKKRFLVKDHASFHLNGLNLSFNPQTQK